MGFVSVDGVSAGLVAQSLRLYDGEDDFTQQGGMPGETPATIRDSQP
jgi:hypothetical protein